MIRTSFFSLFLLGAFLPAMASAQSASVAPAQDVSLDPSTAGIAAVNRAAEILKSGPPEAAIAYFNDALSQARNFAVQRAIRFHLADLYVQAGRQDKALETLKDQIASIPPVAAPTLVQLVPSETPGSTAAPQQ
jgi:tetratricopeptide (TPR) repeat protein